MLNKAMKRSLKSLVWSSRNYFGFDLEPDPELNEKSDMDLKLLLSKIVNIVIVISMHSKCFTLFSSIFKASYIFFKRVFVKSKNLNKASSQEWCGKIRSIIKRGKSTVTADYMGPWKE
jgi:hypothetical protein